MFQAIENSHFLVDVPLTILLLHKTSSLANRVEWPQFAKQLVIAKCIQQLLTELVSWVLLHV